MVIVSINTSDWNTCFGNPTKLFLGILTIIYDSIFIVQHFVIYRENNKLLDKEAQYEPITNQTGSDEEREEGSSHASVNNYDTDENPSINQTK